MNYFSLYMGGVVGYWLLREINSLYYQVVCAALLVLNVPMVQTSLESDDGSQSY